MVVFYTCNQFSESCVVVAGDRIVEFDAVFAVPTLAVVGGVVPFQNTEVHFGLNGCVWETIVVFVSHKPLDKTSHAFGCVIACGEYDCPVAFAIFAEFFNTCIRCAGSVWTV